MAENQIYNKNHPFFASIKERYALCKPGSQKDTQHVVLDLKGSGISYRVGDSIGILPVNDPEIIQLTLKALQATGSECIQHLGVNWSLKEFLEKKANITEVSRKIAHEVCKRQSNVQKREQLEFLLKEENKEAFKSHLAAHELWDFLHDHHEVSFELQELCNLLMPLLPRFYSIASSPIIFKEEIHLTVALLKYETRGFSRRGVCTHYLCEVAPLHQPLVPVYIQPHHDFTLPADPKLPLL